jgi:Bacterial Ig domain/Bacterial cadherin-like domain/Dockerin type I domain
LSVTKSFVVTGNPVNDRPSTTDKAFTTNEDTSITITAAELFAGSAGHANPLTSAPQDESNQTFRIVSLVRGTNSINSTTTNTLKTARGTVVANFDPTTGFLVDLVYTPDLDLNSTDYPNADGSDVLDQFTFVVADDGLHINPAGGSDLVTPPQAVAGVARILVNAVNDLPSFNQPGNVTISEDSLPQTVTITGINPGGNEPQNMSMRVTSSNTFLVLGATVIYDGTSNTGQLVFQPQPDRYGVTTLTVTLTDAGQDNDLSTTVDNLLTTRSFVVVVDPDNDAPGAVDQSIVTVEDTPVTITASQLLAGSTGDAVALQPAPFDETAQTTRIRSLSTVGGTVNATSPVGQSFATTHGSIVARFNSSGFLIDVVYSPNANFNSDNPQNAGLRTRDTFTFTVEDDGLTVMESGPNQTLPVQSSTATARILVTPRNDRPVASDDTVAAVEDTALVILRTSLLGNDNAGPTTAGDENLGTNGNDGALVLVGDSFTTTLGGTVTVQANGNLLYEPPVNAFGQDTFTYTVSDVGENEDVDGTRNIVSLTDTAVVTINIAPVNDPPNFDVDTAITIQEDATGTMFLTNITAGGGETQPLRITALSENTGLIPNPVATYSPATRTAALALVPNPNQFGVTRVFATVEDPGADGDFATTADNLSLSRSFIVRINPVNDAPTLDAIADQSTVEDASATTINLIGIGAGGGETQAIQVRATSSSPALTGTPVVNYTSPAGTGTLTITPVANAFGVATITVVVTDAGLDGDLATTADNGSVIRSFNYTVTAVNDDPTINLVVNQTVNEDAGQQQVQLSGISDGTLENGPVTLTVTSSNPSLIPNPTVSAISSTGTATLSYAPVANQSGVATITIQVSDSGNGGTPRTTVTTFDIVVNAVNDVPTLDAIPDQTMDEDSTKTVSLTGLSAGGGETQSLSVRAISSNETIVSNPTIGPIAANGTATLTLTSVNQRSGAVTISVVIEDGGLDNNLSTVADNLSVTRTFSLNVLPVNDPPTIASIAPVSVNEDSGEANVPLSGISAGAGEIGTVSLTAVSNNPALLGAVSIVHDGTLPIGTLRFTPVADAFGTGTITVSVTDGGSDNNLSTTADNLTTSTTLAVTVLNVNDPPSMGSVSPDPVEIPEDSAPVNVTISAVSGGPGETGGLQVRTSSNDPAKLPNPSAVYDEATGTVVLSMAPASNAFGTIAVTVTVVDPGQDGNFATVADNLTFDRTINVTINGSNDAPVAVGDELASDEDTIASISEDSLIENDTDPDLGVGSSEKLSISLPSLTTTLGVPLTFNPTTRVITYDPTDVDAIQVLQVGGAPLVDTFVYELSDVLGAAPKPRATVTITLAGLNDAPRVVDDQPPFETGDGFIVIRPLRNDTDVDGTINPDSLIITADPQFGSVDRQIVNGEVVLTYSPNSQFEGTDFFRYTVQDNSGRVSDQATVFILPTSGPTVGADVIPVRVGGAVTVDVLANDVPKSGTLNRTSARIDTAPRNGTASFDASGNLVYTPNAGFVGTDSFTYAVSDSEGNVSISPAVEVRIVQSGLTNARNFFDVNANGEVTPLDSLLVMNFLRRRGRANVPVVTSDVGPNFVDTDDSLNVTPLDALLVTNFIRRQRSNRSGESIQVSANAVDIHRLSIASLQQSIFVDTITSVTPQIVIPSSVDRSDDLTHAVSSVMVDQTAADQVVTELDLELATSSLENDRALSSDQTLGRLSDAVFGDSSLDDWNV